MVSFKLLWGFEIDFKSLIQKTKKKRKEKFFSFLLPAKNMNKPTAIQAPTIQFFEKVTNIFLGGTQFPLLFSENPGQSFKQLSTHV